MSYCCAPCRLSDYIVTEKSKKLFIDFDTVLDQLKLTDCDDEAYVQMLVNAAIEFYELYTKRTIIDRTYVSFLDYFTSTAEYEIRKSPVYELTSVEYYLNGVLTLVPATDYYLTQSSTYISVIPINEWPKDADTRRQAIQFTFKAGHQAADTVDQDVIAGILSHVSAMYANRGDCSKASCLEHLPATAKITYNLNRIISLRV